MTYAEAHYMRPDPQLLSNRLKTFVSPYPAKTLADLIGCDVRTAENIRSGHWPIARHWLGLVLAFGRDVTDSVFHPDAAARRLEQELRTLEDQLAKKRAALADAEQFAARLAQVRRGPQDRTLTPRRRATD